MYDIIKKWSNYTQKCIALKYNNALIFEFVCLWQIIHYEIQLVKLRHSTKQTHMQGATMESVYWFYGVKNVLNLYMKQRQIRHRQKYHSKMIQNAFYAPFIPI